MKLSQEGFKIFEEKRNKKGWRKQAVALTQEAHVSTSTLKRFYTVGVSEDNCKLLVKQ